MEAGKRIINIDETIIGCVDYRRNKWRQHGSTNSIPTHNITPRISFIAAIDTEGSCYISLTQTSVDTDFIILYLTNLAIKLDMERPNWREDSVILLDGARPHVSE